MTLEIRGLRPQLDRLGSRYDDIRARVAALEAARE
jgi:hypothetical protein